jgi:apolipoprotein D and lipocalin family protein
LNQTSAPGVETAGKSERDGGKDMGMTAKSTGGSAMVLSLMAATASPAAGLLAPAPAKPVDAARFYNGVWAEIGRRPMGITNGCVAGATAYTLISATRVTVRDTCHSRTPLGREKAIGGPARILDPGLNTKLRVSYKVFGVFTLRRDYWILDHDDAYTWFISADPGFRNLWIYTRNPHVDPQTLGGLVDRAKALGYDVARLEFPAQP